MAVDALPIFPSSGFDHSAITPVFLGVIVSWVFTETLGWAFTGLVVPGYLAALFVLEPRAACVDVGEGIITYAVARLLGEYLARTGLTSRLFGRERFFLVVLLSIVVRIGAEGVLFQRALPSMGSVFSVGLVIVPLTANACWKTGLARGLVQNGIPTLVVYGLLRFVLMPYTNLSLANFSLANENIAANFLSAPKAYIILLTGAALAAYANLRFGWDFNGILIPALLSLVVVNPIKFFATIVEVLVLCLAVHVLRRVTRLGRVNMEGPRRPVLFFCVDYALRLTCAAIIGRRLPTADVDWLGFGYLVPTLLAVKISQKGFASLVLLPGVAVSAGAFALGNVIGFSATSMDDSIPLGRADVARPLVAAPENPAAAAVWLSALSLPRAPKMASFAWLSPARTARLIDDVVADRPEAFPSHLGVQRLDGGVFLLRERFDALADRLGDPSILFRRRASGSPPRVVLVVPTPLRSPEASVLAGRLLMDGAADAVVLAGIEDPVGRFSTSPINYARALANGGGRGGSPGVVVELGRSETAETVVRGANLLDPRVERLLEAVRGLVGNVADGGRAPRHDVDAQIAVFEEWLERHPSSSSAEPSLANPTAMAMAFDGLRVSLEPRSPEEALILRRLVLDRLLGPSGPPRALGLTRFCASALGYVLHGPTPLADSTAAFALLPAADPRPLALLVRGTGVKKRVVEAPHAFHQGTRDFTFGLSVTRQADAVLFGLEPGDFLRRNESLREAHAVATLPASGRRIELILARQMSRQDHAGGTAVLGSWPTEQTALATSLASALQANGVAVSQSSLDATARELSGRRMYQDFVLASVTIDSGVARAYSFSLARGALRRFPGIPLWDGACGECAIRLVDALSDESSPPAPGDLLDLARAAVTENSVVAGRALQRTLGETQSRAALVRSDAGMYLVVVGRTKDALVAGGFNLAPPPFSNAKSVVTASRMRECASLMTSGGACRVEIAQ